MSFKDSKVVIVGCGNVGSTIAYTILNQGLCEQIVLIDRNEEKSLCRGTGHDPCGVLHEPEHRDPQRRI